MPIIFVYLYPDFRRKKHLFINPLQAATLYSFDEGAGDLEHCLIIS